MNVIMLSMPAGKYVVAVSGGVDSVVLLDLLRLHPEIKLTVAHYDHGMRDDSSEDRKFVQGLARKHRLPFVYNEGRLGPQASEATARAARYAFLQKVQKATSADALVTAHHQDDALETMVINLLRGTGRKGLSSLTSGEGIIRPLLDVPKSEIIDYAKRHGLLWREDSTNTNTDYLRNHVRHNLLPNWDDASKAELLRISRHMRGLNQEIDSLITKDMSSQIDRSKFLLLPHVVAREVMAEWLRRHELRDFDSNTVERLTIAAKLAEPGKSFDVVKGHTMHVSRDILALVSPER